MTGIDSRIRLITCRAPNSKGVPGQEETIDAPDVHTFFELMHDIETENALYLIAARDDTPEPSHFLQVSHENAFFILGHRLGPSAPYLETKTDFQPLAYAAMVLWMLDLDGWDQHLKWREVDLTPEPEPDRKRRWWRAD